MNKQTKKIKLSKPNKRTRINKPNKQTQKNKRTKPNKRNKINKTRKLVYVKRDAGVKRSRSPNVVANNLEQFSMSDRDLMSERDSIPEQDSISKLIKDLDLDMIKDEYEKKLIKLNETSYTPKVLFDTFDTIVSEELEQHLNICEMDMLIHYDNLYDCVSRMKDISDNSSLEKTYEELELEDIINDCIYSFENYKDIKDTMSDPPKIGFDTFGEYDAHIKSEENDEDEDEDEENGEDEDEENDENKSSVLKDIKEKYIGPMNYPSNILYSEEPNFYIINSNEKEFLFYFTLLIKRILIKHNTSIQRKRMKI